MAIVQQNKRKSTNNPERSVRGMQDDGGDFREVIDSVTEALANYGRKNPTAVGVAIFFAGFCIGWRLKPW